MPEKGFDIILVLWSKLLLHTWHNKNMSSDNNNNNNNNILIII